MATRFDRLLEAGLRIRPNETRRTAIMAAYAANAIGAVVVGRSVRDALYQGAYYRVQAVAEGTGQGFILRLPASALPEHGQALPLSCAASDLVAVAA